MERIITLNNSNIDTELQTRRDYENVKKLQWD